MSCSATAMSSSSNLCSGFVSALPALAPVLVGALATRAMMTFSFPNLLWRGRALELPLHVPPPPVRPGPFPPRKARGLLHPHDSSCGRGGSSPPAPPRDRRPHLAAVPPTPS